ncbi:MAG: hypothetical protein QGG36_29445 [Pirellulaceae bacterium]|jgi:hypothetical protein|nr:hypothetical protein [Pirellulaceae bacterium]
MKPFQFNIQTILAIVVTFAAAMALSQNVVVGVRVSFFFSLCAFWLGVGCIAMVCEKRDWKPFSIALLLVGQGVVVCSLCVGITCLGLILKSLFAPVVS